MSAPVKHTCPDIDKALKHLKNAWSEIKDLVEDKQSRNSIEYELDYVGDILEQLREDNDSLRTWGKEMEEEKESLESLVDDMQVEIDNMKVAVKVE